MATLNAVKSVNTRTLDFLLGIKNGDDGVVEESATAIDYAIGDTEVGLKGDFEIVAEEVKGGPIDEIDVLKKEEFLAEFLDVDYDLEDLWADAQDDVLDEAPAAIFDGDDVLDGSDEADVLFGWAGNDTIRGAKGNDELNGGEDDDDLTGGKGADEQTGGTGADTFFLLSAGDSKTKAAGRDTILDFDAAEGDIIDLFAIDARKGGKDNAFDFIGRKGFHGDKGELRFKLKDGDAILQGDTDGDGKADFAIVVAGVTNFTGSEIEL